MSFVENKISNPSISIEKYKEEYKLFYRSSRKNFGKKKHHQ